MSLVSRDGLNGESPPPLSQAAPEACPHGHQYAQHEQVEATRHILTENPRVRVIGLSMQDNSKIIDAMRDAGAVGYVSKAEAGENLVDSVRTAWEGRAANRFDAARKCAVVQVGLRV